VIEVILSLSALISSLCFGLYALRQMKQARASIPSLSDFIHKDKEGNVVMREDLVMVIDGFGSRIAKSLKMSLLQGLGAEAKIEKGLKSAITQDVLDNKAPLLGMALDMMGINTKQYIAKHPEAIGQLAQIAAPYMKNLNLGQLMKGNSPGHVSHQGGKFG